MGVTTRILTALGALLLVAAIYLPTWRIELTAPQYPEGLTMTIGPDKLAGDIDIINGLNHYIGMKKLHSDDFREFVFLPWILWFMVAFGVTTALLNKRKVFYTYFGVFIAFLFLALADFYRWEYNYGHNLDPTAPIEVPGMAYQPPLIGYKALLNFGAYSIPDAGGWSLIVTAVLLSTALAVEVVRQRRRSVEIQMPGSILPKAAAVLLIFLVGCNDGPVPIRFGQDNCDQCKMIIMDKNFGGELISSKGKIYRFDDLRCIVDFINSGKADKATSEIYFLVYNGDGSFIKSDSALLMKSDAFRSPMGGNTAAFKDAASREEIMKKMNGVAVKWDDLF